ncbi:MAG: AMP-binding protein [Clostridia bacterium]|nr:AMP-binding protein [Clostridia bacterium]
MENKTIYQKFIGRDRDSFKNYKELMEEYSITYKSNFNYAYDVIDELGKTKPDKLALLYLNDDLTEEIRFTFKDMMEKSNQVANYLTAKGIKKGDRILLVLKRSYWFWVILLAIHKIGAIAVQATHMLMKKDYVYRCNKVLIKAVFITGDDDCTERFDEAYQDCPSVKLRFTTKHKKVDGWIDFEEEVENYGYEFARPTGKNGTKASDTMMLSFSSGTTGYPKTIMHDFTYPLGHIATGVFWHRVVDGGLHFTISDTGWLKSLWGKFYGQWLGESAVLVFDFNKFDGEKILKVLEKYKVTTFCVPPTMYRMILKNDVAKYDLSSLTHCCSAGEALNPEIFKQWKNATGLEIHEGFGQTETTVCISTIKGFNKPHSGSIGLPSPGYDLIVVDEKGQEVLPGETGEICVRASRTNRPCGLTFGYFNDDESNAFTWRQELYHTGDTAYRDEQGYIIYVGRNDDVIKSSGYRIGPFEVESVLLEHPAVSEVAVTGVPDPVRGFNVKATIVLQAGFSPSDELVKELQNYVKENTAPYKYPRVVEFVDALPKTFAGKIRRVEIRENDRKKNKN